MNESIQLRMYERVPHRWPQDPEEYRIVDTPERYARVLQLAQTGPKAWASYCLWPGEPGHTFVACRWRPTREEALAAAQEWIALGITDEDALIGEIRQ